VVLAASEVVEQAVPRLACWARSDGRALFHVEDIAQSGSTPLNTLAIQDDGRVVLLEAETCAGECARTLYRTTVATDGRVSSRVAVANARARAVHGAVRRDGRAFAFFARPPDEATVVFADPAGGSATAEHRGLRTGLGTGIRFTDDGGALLHSRVGGYPGIEYRDRFDRFERGGALRWSHRLDRHDPLDANPRRVSHAHAAGVLVLVRQAVAEHGREPPRRVLERLEIVDDATGALRVVRERVFAYALPAAGRPPEVSIAIDPVAGRAWLVRLDAGVPLVEAMDLGGAPLGERALRYAADAGCGASVVDVAGDGSLRVFVQPSGWISPLHACVARVDPATILAPARPAVGQAGLRGAWYAPETAGQGLVLDYVAGAATVVGNWFTFDAAGRQRWYTIQGAVAAGATRASLTIYRNDGGTFDAQPVTSAERVGAAELILASCNEASLRYSFDPREAEGVTGVLPLVRLAPAAIPCREADGSMVGESTPRVAAIGARHGGGWFEPATSGQGLVFDITPARAGANGFLFAGWFTYEPVANAAIPSTQRWLTIQGPLTDPQADTVTLPIYATSGGVFDAVPTRNTSAIGTATLRFESCDRAELRYRFADASYASGTFASLEGTVPLVRIAGCD
jgi:hypothetical protein